MKKKIKKYGKMIWSFEFPISKFMWYVAISMKFWEKHFWPIFKHFSLVEAKMKVKMKVYGKISSILEFTTSKLVYVPVFMKVWEKTFDPLFKTFWKKIKNEDKSEKNGKLSSIFEFSISKLGYVAVFMKICKKNGWPIF